MALKRLGRAAAVLLVLGVSLFVRSPMARAAEVHDFIVNFNSQKCVDVPGGKSDNNITIIQYECLFPVQDNQLWSFRDTTSGYYEIWNDQTGKCLTVLNASMNENVAIIQYTCNGGTNAQWKPVYWLRTSDDAGINRDWYELVNRKSGLCIHVKNASTANSATLLQYRCNGSANHYWTWY